MQPQSSPESVRLFHRGKPSQWMVELQSHSLSTPVFHCDKKIIEIWPPHSLFYYYLLGSLEGVDSSGQPVDTAVTVQTAGETTVSAATDLYCEVAHALHHPTEKTVRGLRRDGVDSLRLEPSEARQE